MKKLLLIGLTTAALALPATFTGVITDDGCPNGAPGHKEMGMGGPSDAKCVMLCVQHHGSKYMLYDGKESYILSDQKTPAKFAAQKVTVNGTLDAKTKTIKVDSIVPVK
jgi:hypothetical protein